jgi:uncharacterized protein YhbP (UPF0306 family)
MERDVGINELAELLAISTLTLATTGRDGQPHATPVYFASDMIITESSPPDPGFLALNQGSLELFFFSDPLSQHGQDLADNPLAAAALSPPCYTWQEIRGLQLRGRAEKVTGAEQWERGWASYLAKFPFVSTLQDVVTRSTFYVFIPSWMRLVDNRRGFGYKREWDLL